MKLPNGYGSVYKLSGKRRTPYRAVITDKWQLNENNGTWTQKRITIGYFETKTQALEALAEYNKSPFDVSASKCSFEEVYKKWSDEHFQTISDSNIKGYKAAYLLCAPIANKRFVDVTLDDLQYIVDNSGKNTPTLKKFKTLLSGIYQYAVIHDIVAPDRNKVSYLNISKSGNPNAFNRSPFSKEEIEKVWKWENTNEHFSIALMLIYSGVRIDELLSLKKENVNIAERWFDITASKTKAGLRKVPIHKKILPFFKYWYNKNDSDYLLSTSEGNRFLYRNFYDSYWKPLIMQQLNIDHTPHCCRHTCISLLAEAGVDDRMIKKIVGHKGVGVTEIVYTHFEIEALIDAIDKI